MSTAKQAHGNWLGALRAGMAYLKETFWTFPTYILSLIHISEPTRPY